MSMRNVHSLKAAVRPTNTMFSAAIAVVLALLAPACGTSDGGSGNGSGDGSGSGPGGGSCDSLVLADGIWTTSTGASNAFVHGSAPATELSFLGGYGGTSMRFNVRLYSGTSDFPSNPMIAPSGSIDLANDDDIANCGACVYYATGDVGSPATLKYYFATAGTFKIASITPKFSATLSDVILTHVDVDATGATAPSADGCEYTMSSATIYTNVIGVGGTPEPRTLN